MKRWLAALLALVMCACHAGAFAQSEADELAKTALLVRETLGISGEYTEFSGEYYEMSGRRMWSLRWSGEEGSVYASCDADGTVYEYTRRDAGERNTYSSDFAPAVPEIGYEERLKEAQAFMAAVLDEETGWRVYERAERLSADVQSEYTYTGVLTVNGYESDIEASVTVRIADGAVVWFYRDDGWTMYTGFALPQTISDAAQARERLEAAYEMELNYVLAEDSRAVLRYLPVCKGAAYIDAQTGADVEAEEIWRAESAYTMDAAGAAENGLTAAEQSGVDEIAGLMTKAQMDDIVRSYEEFALEGFATGSFQLTKDEQGRYIACLRYQKTLDVQELTDRYGFSGQQVERMIENGNTRVEKNVRLDAATGELVAMYTCYSFGSGEYETDAPIDAAAQGAQEFLERYYGDIAAQMRLTQIDFAPEQDWYAPTACFGYIREVNGALFDECAIEIGVNVYTGDIDSVRYVWADDVEFESAQGVIRAEEALESFLMQFSEELVWAAQLEEIDGEYAKRAVLCYTLQSGRTIEYVDAHTGKCVGAAQEDEQAFAYGDIGQSEYREEIEALAEYRIGFAGGKFAPDDVLTGRDMLLLLLQAGGYAAENWQWEDIEETARDLGIAQNVQPDEQIMREEFAGVLLDMSGYGRAASYGDAFRCTFADEGDITQERYGHIALAQAMGIAKADGQGCFRPGEACTRAEAAQMLWGFLTR